jgi:hypothetical protein
MSTTLLLKQNSLIGDTGNNMDPAEELTLPETAKRASKVRTR